ncbi:hypothetical protein U5801_15670 [Lamprobacter modestohalophilus]|uniref:Uncharacterized protein n=1 Tax=Lamprobacter modestohalophilus TaxID=1064514 RepID=A0A9X0WE73_9GAMM|nr:hypothetical protein [Lamprobacter modestohalophilus]MBK1621814.1 hypothetical protein [Lamprobacter modestohalophilus]MEA1051232.1 hypothetical protein [Lamprobacter modestohalophilus]
MSVLPLCLGFGPRRAGVISALVDAPDLEEPVAGYHIASAASRAHPLPADVLARCDWLALVVDAAEPDALSEACAWVSMLADEAIYLRFA